MGSVSGYTVFVASGWDSVRGIIKREDLLNDHIIVFKNCPSIHSFGVRKTFLASFYTHDGLRCIGREYIKVNRFSGFYKHNAICLESSVSCSEHVLDQAVVLCLT